MLASTRRFVCAAAWLTVSSIGLTTAAAAQDAGVKSAEQYAEADLAARKATLNDLAAHRLSLPAAELTDVLTRALADKDDDVRKRGIFAIVGRLGALRVGAARLPGGPEPATSKDVLVERWRTERPVLAGLRTPLIALLADPGPAVRDGVIMALVLLDYEPGQPANFAVRPETLQLLATTYERESSAKVKVQIVKTFALTSTVSPLRDRLLLQALNDAEPGVLQFAAMGAGEAKLSVALPRLAELLEHPERAVRLNAVQAIAAQGPSAAAYQPQLQAALNEENDEIVRKTLQGAIARLSTAGAGKRN
jgi:HEAT repeat protein